MSTELSITPRDFLVGTSQCDVGCLPHSTLIYFDYNATTPLAPEVLDAMRPYLDRHFGNASSIHAVGREARAAVDDSRDRIARLLGAKSHEIIFTGGGTESDNLAIIGLARETAARGKHLITCATEHHAVLHAFQHLEKREGFRVTWLPVDARGHIDLQLLRERLNLALTGSIPQQDMVLASLKRISVKFSRSSSPNHMRFTSRRKFGYKSRMKRTYGHSLWTLFARV